MNVVLDFCVFLLLPSLSFRILTGITPLLHHIFAYFPPALLLLPWILHESSLFLIFRLLLCGLLQCAAAAVETLSKYVEGAQPSG